MCTDIYRHGHLNKFIYNAVNWKTGRKRQASACLFSMVLPLRFLAVLLFCSLCHNLWCEACSRPKHLRTDWPYAGLGMTLCSPCHKILLYCHGTWKYRRLSLVVNFAMKELSFFWHRMFVADSWEFFKFVNKFVTFIFWNTKKS